MLCGNTDQAKVCFSDQLPIARGNRRLVFVHPENPSICLKVAAPGKSPTEIRDSKYWYKRLRPVHSYDDNHIELCEYQRLIRTVANPTVGLPRIYGLAATNLGPALMQDLIRNSDGTVSSNLKDYLEGFRICPERVRALTNSAAQFTDWLINNKIVVHDLHLQNVVVQETPNSLRFVLIDGLGAWSLVPFEHLLPHPVAIWRLKGKVDRFHAQLRRALQSKPGVMAAAQASAMRMIMVGVGNIGLETWTGLLGMA